MEWILLSEFKDQVLKSVNQCDIFLLLSVWSQRKVAENDDKFLGIFFFSLKSRCVLWVC